MIKELRYLIVDGLPVHVVQHTRVGGGHLEAKVLMLRKGRVENVSPPCTPTPKERARGFLFLLCVLCEGKIGKNV